MCDAIDLSQHRVCRQTGLSLSTCRYAAQRPATDAYLSGRNSNEGVLVTAASSSYYIGRAFSSTTSGHTAFTTLTA